jgi:uncharacterized protein
MIIRPRDIPPEGRQYAGEDDASVFEIGADASVRADRPLRYELTVHVVSGELLVKGRLSTEAAFRCSRCAEWLRREVTEEAYEHARALEPGTESVDLTADLRESILLAFPAYPLCRKGCRGLCPQCGANLNENPCRCRPPPDARWGALEGL